MAKKTQTDKKTPTLEQTLKRIKERYGDASIMKLHDKPNVDIDCVPTGSIGLNHALGIGGFPRGRIIELYGAESSGKTTLALHTIAEAQQMKLPCAIVDAEHALDPQYAKKLGVDTKELLVSQPDGGEEALNIVEDLVKSCKLGVIVVDSVAALVPKAEIDGEIGAMQIGAQARLMSQAMRILTAHVARSKTVVLFINQIRTNIGGYGNPETTAGGRALKFYSSVRLDVRRIASLKKQEENVGIKVRVKVVKNKVASPFKLAEFDIIYNEGIAKTGELILLGEKHEIVTRSGSYYKLGEQSLGQGYDAARLFLKDNPEIANEIESRIKSELAEPE